MRSAFVAAWLAAVPAVAGSPPPDPELLVFLGEMAGEDPEFVQFMESRAARRALKDAEERAREEAKRKEDDDE
jgi:hypothetical protein